MFKEYPSIGQAFGWDVTPINLYIIGGTLIALSFFTMGILLLWVYTMTPGTKSYTRSLTFWFGMFLGFCGSARFLDVISVWHNYANLNGTFRILTGISGMIALSYFPKVIREVIAKRYINSANETLEETKQKLEEVKRVKEKIIHEIPPSNT